MGENELIASEVNRSVARVCYTVDILDVIIYGTVKQSQNTFFANRAAEIIFL